MTTPLRKLRDDLTQLEDEIALLVGAAPNNAAVQDLRRRAEETRRAIEAIVGH